MTFWIDPRSHLPRRWEAAGEAHEIMITRFEDWRDYGGVLLPTRIEQSTGSPENDMLVEVREVQINQIPPPGIFDEPVEAIDDVHFAEGKDALGIPLDIDGVHIFMQVGMNGSEPLWFILDTGASMSVIDADLAEELGLDLAGQAMGSGNGEGEVAVSFLQDVSFQLPGVELTGQTVATIALRGLIESRVGRRVDGILGYNFISRFVVEIDYWRGKLNLRDREGWEYDGNGTVIPIWIVDSVPHCKAEFTLSDGRTMGCNVYIDTGSGKSINFNKPFTEEHDLLASNPERIEFRGGLGVGGETRSILGRLASLKLGDLKFDAPTCSFSRNEKGGRANSSLGAQLGGKILERSSVIFDYERERMILEPNPGFAAPHIGETNGITLGTDGRNNWHRFTVVALIEDSPADRAGIEVGDVIVSVGGIPASEFRKRDLVAVLRETGREIRLGIQRNGEELERELSPFPMF